MTPEQVCELVVKTIGGPAEVSRLFPNLTSQAVSQWTVVPAKRVLTLVEACQGKIEITPQDVRPDIYGERPAKAAA